MESVETQAIEAMQHEAIPLAMKKRVKQGAHLSRVSAMSVFATFHVVAALYVHEVFFEELVGLKPCQASKSSPPGRSCTTSFS